MKKKTILLFLAILFTACEDKVNLEGNPINSNINIAIKEHIEADARTLYLYCSTEKTYSCANYPIITETEVGLNRFKIDFVEVWKTDFCFTAIGPATAYINLSVLGNGKYDIELNNGNIKNNGTLTISDTRIDLHIKKQKGIIVSGESLQRVPQNTYWGSIDYHSKETAAKVNEYLAKVEELGAVFNKQPPGDYSYYEIDNKGDIITPVSDVKDYFLKYFIFNYTGNEEDFKKKLAELGKTYFDEMYIRVETYKGEFIGNWL